jgi:ribose transport system substrate-binding protein
VARQEQEHVKRILAVMSTAGLYDDSGKWLYRTGLPGKSGIGGGIVTVSPGKGGLGHVFRTGLERAMRRGADIIVNIDGDGQFKAALERTRKHLRESKSKRILVGAANDPSALGALRAFQEAGRTDACAIMGHNASPEGRAELREPGTRLVGSVAYFPEKYGAEIVAVALDILHRRAVPPAVFVKHQLVTTENVNHIYPNDELMMAGGLSA